MTNEENTTSAYMAELQIQRVEQRRLDIERQDKYYAARAKASAEYLAELQIQRVEQRRLDIERQDRQYRHLAHLEWRLSTTEDQNQRAKLKRLIALQGGRDGR